MKGSEYYFFLMCIFLKFISLLLLSYYYNLFKKRLFYGDMTFYSVVAKLHREIQLMPVVISQVYSLQPRQVSNKLLKSETYLKFLWSKLQRKELPPVVFLQLATNLKILDVNEIWSQTESRHHLE